jgi:hypothetical protein
MSGLLDKANKEADKDNTEAMSPPKTAVIEVEPVIEGDLEVSSDAGLVEDSELPADPSIAALLLQLAGIVGLLIVSFAIFYTKYVNIFLFGALLAGTWGAFAFGEKMMGRLNTTKIATSITIWIVLAAAASGASFLIGSNKVIIGSVAFDGANDELDMILYGTSGTSFNISILYDEVEVWGDSGEINLDRTTISVPISEVFQGNAMNHLKETVSTYQVRVTSGEEIDYLSINPQLMNHEANAGIVQIYELTGEEDGNIVHQGMEVSLVVGIGDSTSPYTMYADNGSFAGTPPLPINSDYSIKVKVIYDSSTTVYTYTQMTVENGLASGIGEFGASWVLLPGSVGNDLEKESFYDDDGCYTFEVTITNEVTGSIITDSRSKVDLSWNDNDVDDDTSNNQKATAC